MDVVLAAYSRRAALKRTWGLLAFISVGVLSLWWGLKQISTPDAYVTAHMDRYLGAELVGLLVVALLSAKLIATVVLVVPTDRFAIALRKDALWLRGSKTGNISLRSITSITAQAADRAWGRPRAIVIAHGLQKSFTRADMLDRPSDTIIAQIDSARAAAMSD